MQLVVAVDAIDTPAGAVAAAVAYPFGKAEPQFRYKDGRKADRQRPWLTTAQRLPDYLHTAIVTYVKKSALAWVVLRDRDVDMDSDALCTKVLARALERLSHEGHVLNQVDVRVVAFTRTQFVNAKLPSLTTYARTAEYPWILGAAHVLAEDGVEQDEKWKDS